MIVILAAATWGDFVEHGKRKRSHQLLLGMITSTWSTADGIGKNLILEILQRKRLTVKGKKKRK